MLMLSVSARGTVFALVSRQAGLMAVDFQTAGEVAEVGFVVIRKLTDHPN